MRKAVVLTIGLMMAAGLASAQIAGSAHDFSGDTWSDGEICKPCHTTHNPIGTAAPLWDHATTTNTTWTLYSSSTLDATMADPAGISLACLSCHDGTVALDSFGGATGTTFMANTAAGYIGTDLSNDHPVSFTYDSNLANVLDGELNDPATTTAVSDLLFSGQLECASCHDVHNTPGIASMLVMSNSGSALCLTCHDK